MAQAEKLLSLVNVASYKSPEVSSYKISCSNAVNGLETSKLQESAELKRVYDNGFEEPVEKGAWEIKKPKNLTAPSTKLTISVDSKDVELDLNGIGYKHYSELPYLTDFGNFSGTEPSKTSDSGMFSYYNGIQPKPFMEYYDMCYEYPVTEENRHFIEDYYKYISSNDGMYDATSSLSENVKYFYYNYEKSDEEYLIMLIEDGTFTIYRITDKAPF